MGKVPAIHDWYNFTVDHVSDPVIDTEDELVAKGFPRITCPDIRITYEVGISDSCSGEVFVELYRSGQETDDGREIFDMSFSTGNGDNWGMVASARAVQVVLEKHFQLDLHKRYLMTGEYEENE